MTRFLALLAMALFIATPFSVAQAQTVDAVTVSACGTPLNSPIVGGVYPMTQDLTGKLCTSSTGSGGGAVTIADGADVAEGSTADTSANNTVVGNLVAVKTNTAGLALETGGNLAASKADLDALVAAAANPAGVIGANGTTIASTGNPLPTYAIGVTASGATLSENPVANGCLALSAAPTAVSTTQKVNNLCTLTGKQVVLPYALSASFVSGTTSAMTGTTSTSLIAAPGANLRNYITNITCVNSHATVGTFVTVQDGSGGTALYTLAAASLFGGTSITFPTPLRQPTTNTALYVADVTTGANVICSATGYVAE